MGETTREKRMRSELQQVIAMGQRGYSTAIQKIDYPIHQGKPNPVHGWYFLVGSIPASLYDHDRRGSMRWPTLGEAMAAVESAGVERYQLPDCSWNK